MSIPLEVQGRLIANGKFHPKIYIESQGIPHIYGTTDNELAYGLGYIHARDRYFQMEIIIRMMKGSLSEIFGMKGFSSDAFWKPYEFEQKAKAVLQEYKVNRPDFFNYLNAYSEGINDFIKQNGVYDPMYKIFDSKPLQWKTEYSLLVTYFMSSQLAFFDNHIARQEIIDKLPPTLRIFFYPLNPQDLTTILRSEYPITSEKKITSILTNFQKSYRQVAPKRNLIPGTGSNNWVIGRTKTQKSSTIIANDPHLNLTLPGPFYEIHLNSKKLKVYGFSIPGTPLVVSGHNKNIAWGITNGEWDLMDTYRLSVKNDCLYFYNNQWLPFEERKYIVKIRGVGNESIRHRKSIHGKVIDDNQGNYVAQYWYASEKSYSSLALFDMMHGKNWSEFKKALQGFDYPPQNFVFADIYDTIGIVCAGKLPKRPKDFLGGLLDGTKPFVKPTFWNSQWTEENPNEGYLFSANQQPIQNEIYFGSHWNKNDYRVNRINSLLRSKRNWNISSNMKLQQDIVDCSYLELQKTLGAYTIPAKYKFIANQIMNWNGYLDFNHNEAKTFEVLRLVIEEEARLFTHDNFNIEKAPSFKYFIRYLNNPDFMIENTKPKQTIIENILSKTDSILNVKIYPKGGKSDQFGTLEINHISYLPGLGQKLTGINGNRNTISANSFVHSAFRSIFEMDESGIKGFTVMAGGQSGNINSVNYKSQLKSWKMGEYSETQFSDNPKDLLNICDTILFEQ
ncbi:penicillin acylase family protein [Yeosuana marina]|uniref:penicillin acylase family protein n=1 Tax=Yeosuana marina TaxID=1565536 RepID=UPI0030C8BE4D